MPVTAISCEVPLSWINNREDNNGLVVRSQEVQRFDKEQPSSPVQVISKYVKHHRYQIRDQGIFTYEGNTVPTKVIGDYRRSTSIGM